MPCNTAKLYKSVEKCPGKKSLAGIRRRLYMIPKSFIAAWPLLPSLDDQTPPTEMKDLAIYNGDFTLVEGKYFTFIDLKDEASNATFETVGEKGSKLLNNKVNAVITGMPDDVKGFVRQAVDDDIVYVYQQRDGKFCVLGNEEFECATEPSGDTGTEATGATTTTLAINVNDICPVPTYEGKLFLSATEYVDCATGKLETVSQ